MRPRERQPSPGLTEEAFPRTWSLREGSLLVGSESMQIDLKDKPSNWNGRVTF